MEYLEELARRIKGALETGEEPVDQTLRFAVMGENGTCNLGEMTLDKDDYIVAHNLNGNLILGDEVIVAQITEEQFAIIACTSEKPGGEVTGSDKHYLHTQSVASDTWTVKHSLGKYPAVTVVDSAGTVVIGDVEYIDTNTCVLKFNGAFSGKAYFN